MGKEISSEKGIYSKGKHKVDRILHAAAEVLIDGGYHNFSMRKVASVAGIRLGNLQYYFPSKDELVLAMLDQVIEVYLQNFDRLRMQAGDPKDQFMLVMKHIIFDLNSKQATRFFPELWSLSNHDEHITVFMDHMYGRYRQILSEIIGEINSGLTRYQTRRLALFISCSIEGHTPFIGYHKPWTKETKNIFDMAMQSFLWLIENGDIPGGR